MTEKLLTGTLSLNTNKQKLNFWHNQHQLTLFNLLSISVYWECFTFTSVRGIIWHITQIGDATMIFLCKGLEHMFSSLNFFLFCWRAETLSEAHLIAMIEPTFTLISLIIGPVWPILAVIWILSYPPIKHSQRLVRLCRCLRWVHVILLV